MGPSIFEYELPVPDSDMVVTPPAGVAGCPATNSGDCIGVGAVLVVWDCGEARICLASFIVDAAPAEISFCLLTEHNWLCTSLILSSVVGLLCTNSVPQSSQINSLIVDKDIVFTI